MPHEGILEARIRRGKGGSAGGGARPRRRAAGGTARTVRGARAAGPVLVIAGPTASGKSALALAVAEEMGGVVINADSMQLYRELEILTNRPSREDMARAPHRLYGVIPAAQPCSAGRWREMALGEIAAAHRAGRLPVLVGGTGMYLKALTEGLAPVPKIPERVRAAARALHARLGPERFHAELARRDPVMAARLRREDTQRLIRAFEVVAATGRSLAEWQERRGTADSDGAGAARYATVVLEPPRAELYAACDRRFDDMVARGAVEEVSRLEALGLDPGLPAMKAVGVPELRRYLHGELTLEEACALARRATRRYAKRQITWFRHQAKGAHRVHAQYSESLRAEIFPFIRRLLLTGGG